MNLRTSDFDFNPASKIMSQDISNLRIKGGINSILKVASVRSGHTNTFKLSDTIKDIGGDVMYWCFKSDDVDVRIRIYND